MSNTWFQFKQFRIEQARTALKVGTDGVLLGAWCDVSGCSAILDVGCGSGLIALMVAQRSGATITAVEIDPESGLDADFNFESSPWRDRLKLHLADFKEFQQPDGGFFDLIVSNPPFFQQSLKSADQATAIARHDCALTYRQLILHSRKILAVSGRLAVILPADTFWDFREEARLAGFYLRRKTEVIPRNGKAIKRVLAEFSQEAGFTTTDELVILTENGDYSASFQALTREFYLNL